MRATAACHDWEICGCPLQFRPIEVIGLDRPTKHTSGVGAMTKFDTGFRKLGRACQMGRERRLSFFAEGFPIILSSARNYRNAALQLQEKPREASVLNGYATEEAAKILILMDAVRCPESIRDQYLSKICGWFYKHHVRLVYAEACSVTGYDVSELQTEFVDFMRKSHRRDGPGAPIVPQWELWEREANLYADVACTDDGMPYWHSPTDTGCGGSLYPGGRGGQRYECTGIFHAQRRDGHIRYLGGSDLHQECRCLRSRHSTTRSPCMFDAGTFA